HGGTFEAAQPVDVVPRDREPLDVGDVRVERVNAPQEPRRARDALGALQQQTKPRARPPTHKPGRQWKEDLVSAVALRLGHVAVRERRGQERDVVAAAGGRRGGGGGTWGPGGGGAGGGAWSYGAVKRGGSSSAIRI